ncbi:Arsenate reductase, glutaredoxin family [Nonlabens sp. Hel1_33_55]|uniref:arsenate reductase family protein n=1 Tax=Nonlabens sp. Hel1_33_55 TaxID=1336802 RepID=UPI000875A94F|nr:ArsC/Spx/MgsR family protein [Nonlabens sp. Hel1_33_55]SCY28856.1 Arsenate reductase, glutaredoxin family [Nonlabens sp. Hel1_33_55]
MENLFIYLDSCNTCQRILKELELPESVKLQNTKEDPVTIKQIEYLKEQSGSYESLFNRRAQLYRGRNLHEKDLNEDDYKELLLDHYTFLKRPILIYKDQAYIGNSKKVVAAAKSALAND